MRNLRPENAAADVTIFALASAGTYLAQNMDRPITAVLIYLSGVIIIATHSGLLNGVFSAIAASLTFNFFLSEPAFQFGLTSADEAVPLIAFNLCAILAGILVGQLKDSAKTARIAQSQTAFLLTVSDRLQRALKIEDIEKEIQSIMPTQSMREVEIYLAKENHYFRPSTGVVKIDKLQPLLDVHEGSASTGNSRVIELQGTEGALGIVKYRFAASGTDRTGIPDLQSLSNLLALAVERCLLLERVAEARASLRSEELKDAILSSVSHDLRTPLTAIEAAASALSSTEVVLPPAEQRAMLLTILGQCKRLNRYTSDLLDMGQIQAGISKSMFETVELGDILSLAVNHAKGSSTEVTIERNFAPEPLYVLANATMLEQVFFNIIDNAIKYGECNDHRAFAIIVTLSAEANQGLVSVTDYGPGISKADQERVFTRFFKSDAGEGREGSGLGLFISKGFAEAFGGSVRITSPMGTQHGTTMEVRLPLVSLHPDLETKQ